MTAAQAAVVHTIFEWLALFVGVRLYLRASKTTMAQLGQTRNFAVIIGCIVGAAVGNKLVHWLDHAERWSLLRENPLLLLQGQSMVGGLLGGLLGVELGKKLSGVRESTGDRFVLPVLAGIVIGRMGCFLAGLYDDTYGTPTTLPWGYDFGDGIARHPTQVYEMLFAAGLGLLLTNQGRRLAPQPGLQFKCMLAAYLGWRVAVDFLKPVPYAWAGGLSGIQWVCVIALIIYLPLLATQWRRLPARSA